MKGKFSILSFASIVGSRESEEGDWNYENGIITRGVLRKKSINLATQLKEIKEISGVSVRLSLMRVVLILTGKALYSQGGTSSLECLLSYLKKENLALLPCLELS